MNTQFLYGLLFGVLIVVLIQHFPKLLEPFVSQHVEITIMSTWTTTGGKKIRAIKHIRTHTRMALKDAKEAAEGKPFTLHKEVAFALLKDLNSEGVTAVVRRGRATNRGGH